MRSRVAFFTLGCKLNSYETESLRGVFHQHQYDVVDFDQPAEYYVINTCAVTGHAESDARQLIRSATKKNPAARVIVTGCYAQRDAQALAAMPEVALVVGNGEKTQLFRLFEDTVRTPADGDKIFTSHILKHQPTEQFSFGESGDIAAVSPFTRATIKVQDGCNDFCSFCIIPHLRGKSASRPVAAILEHARALAAAGYKEIDLTGVHTGAYGEDLDPPSTLLAMLEQLVRVEGIERVRLNSIEPATVSDGLLDFIAASPKICKHLHICLQSGNDEILRRMRRHYDAVSYERLVAKVMARMPECGLGSDLLVGFPGETEAHFEQTYRVVERLPFSYLHVFSYSSRPGTPAAKYPDQVHPAAKKERSQRLRQLGQAKKKAFAARFLGRELPILLEGKRDKTRQLLSGLTENYIRVHVDAPEACVNRLVPVRLVAVESDGVLGEWTGMPRTE
ncbi:MAG: tRNA (N(6)-L-threonylcarbamoyladenosine(37)-C(2))-methylthiotransferase MtaB [Candidatus Tectomicrobia bacterium]|nr:tRNA (N(6)-L-threonylcarbamoyladenosine(37)-C(2))-methylthiotransferase MtaB [Candidatus Tectomicrobia bacterium]